MGLGPTLKYGSGLIRKLKELPLILINWYKNIVRHFLHCLCLTPPLFVIFKAFMSSAFVLQKSKSIKTLHAIKCV